MHALLTSIGSFGDINPYIGLGRALISRGHRVTLTVPNFYAPYVERAGLECRPFRGEGNPTDQVLVERVLHPFRGAEFLVRDLLMPTVEDAYQDLLSAASGVDVIVSHPLTFAVPLVAETIGCRWAGAVLAPLSFFSRTDPPLIVNHPVLAAIHRRWPWLSAPFIPLGRALTRSWVAPLRQMRHRLGLKPGGHPLYEGQFSPHLNLALFSRVLAEPQADWPVRTVITGAIAYDAGQGEMPAALSAFLDRGEPPIVFTLGSAAVQLRRAADFYDVGLRAARSLGRRAVFLVGQSAGNRPAVDSDRMFVAEWAPHSAVFRRAAAVVHAGGAGTLHTALAAGRPMVVVPFAHDQPDNAARAERLRVARVIYPQRCTVARLHSALESLLSSEEVISRAAEVAAVVRADDGAANAAAALIDSLNDQAVACR